MVLAPIPTTSEHGIGSSPFSSEGALVECRVRRRLLSEIAKDPSDPRRTLQACNRARPLSYPREASQQVLKHANERH